MSEDQPPLVDAAPAGDNGVGPVRASTLTLRCPRCRYDMRAAATGWACECPVEGRCSECGLRFRWGEVFDPWVSLPRWSVEYSPRRRVPMAAVATVLRSAATPFIFWRRLRMAMPIRAGRLAAYVAGLLVALPLTLVVLGQAFAAPGAWRSAKHQMRLLAAPPAWLPAQAPGDANWPAVVAAFVHEQATGRTSRGGDPALVGRLEAEARRQELAPFAVGSIDTGSARFLLHWTLLPLSAQSPGAIVAPDGRRTPLLVPLERVQWTLRRARSIDGSRVGGGDVPAVGGAMLTSMAERVVAEAPPLGAASARRTVVTLFALLLPPYVCMALSQLLVGGLVFLLLPQTRRRARVGWWHIARVMAYGAWIVAIPAVLPLVASIGRSASGLLVLTSKDSEYSILGLFSLTFDRADFLCRVASLQAVPVLLFIWWATAARFYLKVPHAWAVALAQSIIASGVTVAIFPATLWWLLDRLV